MPIISVQNLTFDYAKHRALDNISFEIEPGTVTGLVGPNGAGKTTLMSCLAALITPVTGEITVDGINVHHAPRDSHRVLSYLPDFFGLYEELTVNQCLTYIAMAQNIPSEKLQEAVQTAAKHVALDDRMNQKAGTLSRGLKQRLAIAQAIIHQPKILLLDEPAAGLDPKARHDLSKLFLNLQSAGMTLLVSSHILSELDDYCTHMMIIDNGTVTEFCDINTMGQAQTTQIRSLEITLTAPHKACAELLNNNHHISQVKQVNDKLYHCQFSGDANDLKTCLEQLIGAGVPVCDFHTPKQNMQSAYLERVSS